MARYRIQFVLPSTTALPRDDVVNVFHVQADDVTDAGACATIIWENFYEAIGDRLSVSISRSEEVVGKIYDLADAEPRTPVAEGPFGFLPSSSDATALPAEVALCVSLEAGMVSGGNPQRRRGRIYVGPFNGDQLNTSGSYGRPSAALQAALADAAKATAEAMLPLTAFWCIYSRVDNQFRAVIRGWVDNEWDTQRRRGRDASSRQLFVVEPP